MINPYTITDILLDIEQRIGRKTVEKLLVGHPDFKDFEIKDILMWAMEHGYEGGWCEGGESTEEELQVYIDDLDNEVTKLEELLGEADEKIEKLEETLKEKDA